MSPLRQTLQMWAMLRGSVSARNIESRYFVLFYRAKPQRAFENETTLPGMTGCLLNATLPFNEA